MSTPLPRSRPEPMGVSPAAITRFIDSIEQEKLELHGFIVLRHGAVVAQGIWKPYSPENPHMLFSLSKSFASTAVGFAVAEGLLSLDDPVLKFFTEEAPEVPGRYWADMRVRHLLSMSTGHHKDTTGFMMSRRDGDWAKGFLMQPVRHKPGTHFLYNTGASYMLSAIVQRLTGRRLLDYLSPRLFEPLGIEGATWEQCPKGVDTGGFGLSLKTGDIARFGQFLLQRGQWEGKQLLPAAWVDGATAKQVDNGNADGTSDWGMGYGYQFWRCIPGCYRGDGAFGQYCVVMPAQDAVIAITAGLGDMQAVLKRIWDILLPAMGAPLPENPTALGEMETRLAGLRYHPPAMLAQSPLETELSGKTILLEKNPDRRKTMKLCFGDDVCMVETAWGKGRIAGMHGGGYFNGYTATLAYGRQNWAEGSCETPRGPMNCAASFTWEDERTLVLTVRDVNAPFVITEKLWFTGAGVEIKTNVNVSFGPAEQPPVLGKMM